MGQNKELEVRQSIVIWNQEKQVCNKGQHPETNYQKK